MREQFPTQAEEPLPQHKEKGPQNSKEETGARETGKDLEYLQERAIRRGAVMLDGVRYYFGKGEEFKNTRLIKISEKLGGIVIKSDSEEDRLIYTFETFDKDESGPQERESLGRTRDPNRKRKEDIKLIPVEDDSTSDALLAKSRLALETQYENEEKVSQEELETKLTEVFENVGLIKTDTNGIIIVNPDKLRRAKKVVGGLYRSKKWRAKAEVGQNSTIAIIKNYFKKRKVISEHDYENAKEGQLETKQFIYSPTGLQAIDIQAIRESEFYLAPWEVGPYPKTDRAGRKGVESISPQEESIALMIYHPRYGNGYRDENDRLMVWWPSKEAFFPISADWFGREMIRGTGSHNKEKGGSIRSTPRTFLEKSGKHLTAGNLLRAEDFGYYPPVGSKESIGHRRKVGEGGSVMFDRTRYYIGKGRKFKGAEVAKLSDSLGGVYLPNDEGEPVLEYIFDLKEQNDPRLNMVTFGNNTYYDADKELTSLIELNQAATEHLPDNESPEILGRYSRLIQFAHTIEDKLETNILRRELSGELADKLSIQVREAIINKVGDLLKIAPKITRGETDLTFEDLKNAMGGLIKILEILSDTENGDTYELSGLEKQGENFSADVHDKANGFDYRLKIFVRPEPGIEGQARINIELDFKTARNQDTKLFKAFSQTTTYKRGGRQLMESVLRIGIDRDTSAGGSNPSLSIDFGRNKYDGKKFSRQGDVLGNILDTVSEHHSKELFDSEFAETENFASIARAFDRFLEQLVISKRKSDHLEAVDTTAA